MENALLAPSRWRRFLAMLTNTVVFALIVLLFVGLLELTAEISPNESLEGIPKGVFLSLPILLWLALDFPVSTRFRGNAGTLLLKLRVVTKSGGEVSILRSVLRFISKTPLFFLPIMLVFDDAPAVILFISLVGALQLLSILGCLAWNKPTIDDLLSGTRIVQGKTAE